MTKFVTTFFILYICSISTSITYDAANYIAYIEELSHDEKFIDEYQKWSLELFSHSDYLYGKSYTYLSCPIEDTHENINITPTSVHKLRPQDIKCVGAMGDSFTTGLGAHAITPIDLLIESRGEIQFEYDTYDWYSFVFQACLGLLVVTIHLPNFYRYQMF